MEGKWGARGREAGGKEGVRGEGSGGCGPPCPPPPFCGICLCTVCLCPKTGKLGINLPRHEKTCLRVCDKVRHKPTCLAAETS